MKKFVIGFFIVVGLIFIIGAIILGVLYVAAPDRYNVLIIGTDQRGDERSRSDVLMVFSIPKNPKEQTTLLTIPRDSKVEIPGEGEDKITHAYVYGKKKDPDSSLGNVDLTQSTVENLLGIKMDATLEYNFDSFSEIVDLIGGVNVDGTQMDSDDALLAARNRYRAGGDFARTEDQRQIFQSILAQAKNKDVATALYHYMTTSKNARLQFSRMSAGHFGLGFYMRRLGRISIGDITEEVVPGKGGTQYSAKFGQNLYFWGVDEEGLEEIVEEGFR
ncbi:LCP family protein [Patescibacteria group bacterium]|nr:LCP family protein [Patescibacteria group bacterium]